jgi:hypothetical protein
MLYSIGSPLPEYKIRAVKSDACNLMGEDAFARKHGFKSGLVPGITIYAYMSRSLVDFSGADWLKRGSAEVEFHAPVYEGDEIRIAGHLESVTRNGTLRIEYHAENQQGLICGTGFADIPPHPPEPEPSRSDYPAGDGARRAITFENLKTGKPLQPILSPFNRSTHWEYCEKTVHDHHPAYRERIHPGWLLLQANALLTANYELPPWIHVSSVVQNYYAQEQECLVETRGTVIEKFELRGDHYLVLDAAIFVGERCLSTVRNTVIFRIAPRVA